MLKIKLGDIFVSKEPIEKLVNEKLSIKTLYKLNKFIELLPKEIEFVEKQRTELIKKYGEEIDNGNWKVKDENLTEFNKEITELFDIEIELQTEPFTITELENVEMNFIEFQKMKSFIQ